ncbi:type VII secretion protein EsaB [Staphylococcus simulans]|uniref:EsaB/YukD family protein n=1 Tax=Staphylococcus simulans TaxID=1286 RepID=UPI000D09EC54|nr:EsaB/YukD family protein [Staphylococcus simulans]AVO03100.1 type VII secretion protein EsaB [Staphylococcus simulans]AVO06055.1 type VII secretion protein EsaB [Staphylococcus simulans]AWG19648.1 type VII secretion protein EsaB [Staphylococcus simulans]AWI02597.1 type VII secretion protein EsaB [Staphylococcus simulans]
MKHHINITLDFKNYNLGTYDLAVPIHLPIKRLIPLIIESLELRNVDQPIQVKVITKSQLLTESDCLKDFNVGNGDILKVI